MKEALKLALEALEWINRVNAMDYEYQQKAREALNAIYDALAQPEQEPCGGCGGSGWVPRDPDIGTEQECFDCNGSGEQPEQEPVAWEQFYPDIGKPQLGQEPVAIYRAGQAKGEGFHVEFLKEMGDDEALLYTTPPKRPWVGLTDDELVQIGVATGLERAAAQMIESKLKEKNT